MAQPIRFPAIVERISRHTSDVVSYRLRADKRLPRFTPGQFIHLTVEPFDPASFWPESRVFSVANAVPDRRTVDLTISRQGVYTSKILDQLKQGDQVWAKGPYGDFTIDNSHGYRHSVLIAGGTGITPFCAFMDAALSRGALPVEQATLFYGAQSSDLLIYRDLVERCEAEVDGFQVHYCVELDNGEDDSAIRRGRIDLSAIVNEISELKDAAFYLSGPNTMIHAFQERLIYDYGLLPQQIFVDAWD